MRLRGCGAPVVRSTEEQTTLLVVAAQPVKVRNVLHATQSQYLPVFPEDDAATIKALCFVPDPLDPVVIKISLISTAPPGLLEYFRWKWPQQQQLPAT